MFSFLNSLACDLVRRKKKVIFNNPLSVYPVSTAMGCDRGMPIDRYYIDTFLTSMSGVIGGDILEISEDRYAKQFGGNRVRRIDVLHASAGNPKATIVGDLADPTSLPRDRFDCFICTQTFNFIFDIQGAIAGAFNVLKPGGVLLATVSGLSQISRYDMDRWGDYWRFTTDSIGKLIKPVFGESVEIRSFGNGLAATAFLQGLSVEDVPERSLLDFNDPDYQILISIGARKNE